MNEIVWVCNRCGQRLERDAVCNSGIHVGPDGKNVGKPIRTDVLIAAADRMATAANGLLWLDNNREHYGTDMWLEFFDSAVADARIALGKTS